MREVIFAGSQAKKKRSEKRRGQLASKPNDQTQNMKERKDIQNYRKVKAKRQKVDGII